MFNAIESPYLVPFKGGFQHTDVLTTPPKDTGSKKDLKERLDNMVCNPGRQQGLHSCVRS